MNNMIKRICCLLMAMLMICGSALADVTEVTVAEVEEHVHEHVELAAEEQAVETAEEAAEAVEEAPVAEEVAEVEEETPVTEEVAEVEEEAPATEEVAEVEMENDLMIEEVPTEAPVIVVDVERIEAMESNCYHRVRCDRMNVCLYCGETVTEDQIDSIEHFWGYFYVD